ncbi:MAG: keto-deoxy-phosphogluconate aldolase, partial [Cyanobacteria bacterium P01_E01_bin.45]
PPPRPPGPPPPPPPGGATCDKARSVLDAGAIAIGLATHLFPKDLVRERDWGAIEGSIRSFLEKVR